MTALLPLDVTARIGVAPAVEYVLPLADAIVEGGPPIAGITVRTGAAGAKAFGATK